MAATHEVAQLPDEHCPDCGSGFAMDRKHIGYRRHLQKLPKQRNGAIVRDKSLMQTITKCGFSCRKGQPRLTRSSRASERWGIITLQVIARGLDTTMAK